LTQQDSVVMLWDPQSGKLLRVLREAPYPQKSQNYSPLGFSLDSKKVVVASDSKIDVRNANTGQVLQRIKGLDGGMIKVLSPDGKVVFSDTWPNHRGYGAAFWRVK